MPCKSVVSLVVRHVFARRRFWRAFGLGCAFISLVKGEASMAEISFSKDEKDAIVKKIQAYFNEELDSDIGQFDAMFLLDFFAEEVGAYFYNRGLYDAQALLAERVESLSDSIYELEKPTDYRR